MSADRPDSAGESSPSTQEELRALLVENFGGAKRPIVPIGGGTSFEGGLPLPERATKVATRGLDRVVEFAARDMTITVEAGICIARLDEVLRGEGLRLPIDIPQWGRATLGGALAANASGPRRYGLGTFRDYVIGLTAMKADGQVFHSGGRVVKNVAGYDLCKLLVGSLGTLAIVSQVTLKLKPIPEASALVCAAFNKLSDREAAVAALLASQTRPIAIDTLNAAAVEGFESRLRMGMPVGGPAVIVGYEGTQRETDWQIVTLLNELTAFRPLGLHVLRNADAGPLWSALTEFPVCVSEESVFEARLLPSKVEAFENLVSTLPLEIVVRSGNGDVFVKARPGEEAPAEDFLACVERFAKDSGEPFGILRSNCTDHPKWRAVQPPKATQELMRRLKGAFDPQNLLNPLAEVAPE